MRNRILYYSVLILFGTSASINAQRLHELTPYSFYQEWSLDSEESYEELLVYMTKKNVNPVAYDHSFSHLKFNRQNHDLYYRNPKISKKIKPISWSNTPKTRPRGIPRCGNEFIGRKNKGAKLNWRKGIWNVYAKDETKFLVLKYMVSEKGKAYKLERKEEFQIVSLEEDKMVLRKVNDHAENF